MNCGDRAYGQDNMGCGLEIRVARCELTGAEPTFELS